MEDKNDIKNDTETIDKSVNAQQQIYKNKLRIELGCAVFGGILALYLARKEDRTDKILSVLTGGLFFYQFGNLLGDFYHLNKI